MQRFYAVTIISFDKEIVEIVAANSEKDAVSEAEYVVFSRHDVNRQPSRRICQVIGVRELPEDQQMARSGAAPLPLVYSDAADIQGRFPIGCQVIMPGGRVGEVADHAAGQLLIMYPFEGKLRSGWFAAANIRTKE